MAELAAARTGAIEELGAWLGSDEADRPDLATALAATLGDPSFELVFWDTSVCGYVDAAGRAARLPEEVADRGALEVTVAGRRVGAIVYDATLIADEELLRAAGRVVALALDRERLTVELRASRERLRVSRARILEAADAERRRIAHDLHDGLQTRLVLLALQANDVHYDATASPSVRVRAAELLSGLDDAIAELRELAQGVVPATLTERGLYAAAEDLADRFPIPIRVELDAARAPLPAVVETTAYFVLSEALANALKHSRAEALELRIERRNGHLEIEVSDDGIGGAGGTGGTGLRGIADRVEALEGRLTVDSPPGGGTRVLAQVPCAP
jgi:signal transduction histidine kinase